MEFMKLELMVPQECFMEFMFINFQILKMRFKQNRFTKDPLKKI